MSDGGKFIIPERFAHAPVRVTITMDRVLYEQAEQVVRLLNKGTLEDLIISLLKEVIEELEAEGVDLKPFWEKG